MQHQGRNNTGVFCVGLVVWLGFMAWVFTPPASDQEYLSAQEAPKKSGVKNAAFQATEKVKSASNSVTSKAKSAMRAATDKIKSAMGRGMFHGKKPKTNIELTAYDVAGSEAFPVPPELKGIDLTKQTAQQAHQKSWGCLACHKGSHDPHYSKAINLGCTDCHGGDASETQNKYVAHIQPIFTDVWGGDISANPVRTYTLLNHEKPEFIRFNNPGDLRVAHLSCGTTNCHPKEVLDLKKSMMTHGCMLWGAALYNNGAYPKKWSRFGESYSMFGTAQRVQTVPPPTEYEKKYKGVLPFLEPLQRFQKSHPGNILRIFERGGRFVVEVGIPERLEEPGRPRFRLSTRGLGTTNRTDPVYIGLQKTRLLDPTLNFPGTNDHAGDYRQGGCTACHVVYANDRSTVHSGPFAKYGNKGQAASETDEFVLNVDPTIPTNEPGHPIAHRFTRAMPTSLCIGCHIHPGTTVMNSYLGYLWWDQESDGEFFYPPEQKYQSSEEFTNSQMRNPNDTVARTNLTDEDFLSEVTQLNPSLKKIQVGDFHGHGWTFRAVFKKDRQGHVLDKKGNRIEDVTAGKRMMAIKVPEIIKDMYKNRLKTPAEQVRLYNAKLASVASEIPKGAMTMPNAPAPEPGISPRDQFRMLEEYAATTRDGIPVHMLDIHLEKGMHCIDCHYIQDNHGDAKLYGEVRAAVEIQCIDCHGTVTDRATMITSGPAAKEKYNPETKKYDKLGRNLRTARTPYGNRRFDVLADGRIIQHSMVEKGLSWEVTQVTDVIDPKSPDYNALAALAKTVRFNDAGK
ncbi:MAG: hypothetical protein CMJ78_17865, partial [Planctomycetaceae bacterium]|nr:hypothetical protein [Planctomycetaceae bacterium]